MSENGILGSILVVDDDPLVLMNYSDLLSENSYNPVSAGSLSQAWILTKERSFDLIICDHDLGDGKGMDLIDKLLQSGDETPILFLSAASQAIMDEAKSKKNVREVLNKPVDRQVLLDVLKRELKIGDSGPYSRLVALEERKLLLNNIG